MQPMLCKRASSALRDGRPRPSRRLVAAWPRGQRSRVTSGRTTSARHWASRQVASGMSDRSTTNNQRNLCAQIGVWGHAFAIEGFGMPTKRQAANAARDNKAESTGMDAVSALDLLEEDHIQVDDLFEKYEQLDNAEEKKELALKICLALRVHAQIEEEIFYPAVRDAIENTDRLDEAIVEHAAAKQLITEIEGMDAGDELYDAKVTVLNEQVLHHIEEEEDELFPEVENSKLDLETLGKKMADRKAALLNETATGK